MSGKLIVALTEYMVKNKVTNIHIKHLDIWSAHSLNVKDTINLVYMHGVLMHLNNPGRAINNIFNVLDSSCKFFFSIYLGAHRHLFKHLPNS